MEDNKEEGNKEKVSFGLKVTKKNPKPNAKTYEIQTIKEFFEAVNVENHKRMLKDFKKMVEISVHLKVIFEETAKILGQENKTKITKFTWIDD